MIRWSGTMYAFHESLGCLVLSRLVLECGSLSLDAYLGKEKLWGRPAARVRRLVNTCRTGHRPGRGMRQSWTAAAALAEAAPVRNPRDRVARRRCGDPALDDAHSNHRQGADCRPHHSRDLPQ